MFVAWLGARLSEASTWGGIAAVFGAFATASLGAQQALSALGFPHLGAGVAAAGVIVGVIGASASGAAAFIMREGAQK